MAMRQPVAVPVAGGLLHSAARQSFRGWWGTSALVLVAACAAAPPPPPPAPAKAHRGAADADPWVDDERLTENTPRPAVIPSHRLEEGDLGETSTLPSPPESMPTPSRPQEQVAALPSPALAAPVPSVPPAESESLLSRIGPQTPPNVTAALRLVDDGRQEMDQKHYDQALDRFERAVAIDPGSAYGYYYLAQLHFTMKKYDQAIAFASRAIALGARSDHALLARAYSLQGTVYEQVGRYSDARAAYQHAVEADPNNLSARAGAARLSLGAHAP